MAHLKNLAKIVRGIPMNILPLELSSLSSIFRIPLTPDAFSGSIEALARLHAFALVALHRSKTGWFEQAFLDESSFLKGYASPEATTERQRTQAFLDQVRSTPGLAYEPIIDPSGRVMLATHDKSVDMFPFALVLSGVPFWFLSCRQGTLIYTDVSGNLSQIDPATAGFEDAIEALLERGWYRVVLKVLESTSDARRKPLENKVYSAHCFLACEYYKARRYQEAVWEFEKAMRIKANMPQLFYNLALSYAKLNACRTGIQILNQLNRIKPGQFKTYELLGDLYFQQGEWDRAQALYGRAMDLSENKAPLTAKMKRLEDKVQRPRPPADGKKEDDREDKFSILHCLQDLTLEAELGKFTPVFGREKDIQQALEILACQSKKNVLILGEPGVGKTALVQELAYRMAAGKVSPRLQERRLFRVNMGALLAGAKFRGQFEERLMHLLREARKLSGILFFDDIHQIVTGGGGKAGGMEASHFIKPALLNDEIQIIGATSFEDFRNTVEKDTSFLRCFQIVRLEEPDSETLMKILRAYRSSLESYHHVIINEESLETTLMWVKVLLRDRALPDKALDLLDRAAARISIQEKTAIVSSEAVLETISEISGVPLNRISVSEKIHFRNVENFLSQRVIGQQGAISTVSRVLCTSKLRMNLNPARPKGIFLFVGPTGVGKTELAKAMAQFLFGHEDKVIRIDMSEYMERYSASRLIGTSPGYVGYYDQNQLVDKIRSNPYSLILLDEIEKADAQLLNIFLQVFDAGRLTDGKGKIAYFDNTTIVMTSNIGTHLFAQNKLGYGAEAGEGRVTRSDLMKEVKRFFQPEFLNRIDEIVFFKPLEVDDVRQIAENKLTSIFEKMKQQDKEFTVREDAMLELCRIGYDYEYGARNLERVLRRHLLDRLAELALMEDWPSVKTIVAEWQHDDVVLKTQGAPHAPEVVDSSLEEQGYLEQ